MREVYKIRMHLDPKKMPKEFKESCDNLCKSWDIFFEDIIDYDWNEPLNDEILKGE